MTIAERPLVTPTVGGQELHEVDPRTLFVDPNVRHAATADLVASVAEHGVLVLIVGVGPRTEDGQVGADGLPAHPGRNRRRVRHRAGRGGGRRVDR